ncbi:UNVERIFIED_ORG: hypothetical protein M2435_006897 [Rhizobium sophorae]|nr:hypothetical protein [Rhizobium leguminosarum]MDH6663950.1 hypothetical protein [Rhizobium sophorae]
MSSFTSASEVSVGADGLASVLDQFRVAPTDDLADLPIADRHAFQTKMVSVSKAIGGRLPDAPRGFPGQQSADGFARYFEGALSASRGDVSEISAVGAATTADLLFNAASIGPMVVSAADFSRIEDISDIFKFGQFADRIASMTGAAAVGAGNNLRGYVSEQIVAARRGRREVDRVKARIVYVAKYWEALKLFLADGRIEIDNNSIERTIARMRSLP